MDNQLSYYRDLLKKYLSNDISEGEANELFDFIRDQPERAQPLLQESGGDEYTHLIKQTDPNAAASDRMRSRLLQALNSASLETSDEAPIYSIKPKRRPLSWAAAIFIGICFTGYFVFFNKTEKPTSIAQMTLPSDVPAPKSNRATITLAGGKTIFLDSAANGQLAVQGKSVIEKVKNGVISYASENKASDEKEITFNTLSNPRGSQVINLTLSDGTKVWLNAESSIHYPTAFIGNQREVEVTGEAYFEVKHNATQPFRVKAADQLIEDIGTAFNVNAYNNEKSKKTTLVEGSVKLVTEDKKWIVLKPGEQAVTKEGSIKIEKDANIKEVLAWKNGQFFFHEATMEEIMHQVERWYDVDVEYKSGVPSGNYNGRPSRNLTMNQMLEVIRSAGVKFSIEGKKIIVE